MERSELNSQPAYDPYSILYKAVTQAAGETIRQQAHIFADRLLNMLEEPLNSKRVFVAYGGGKDSTFSVAFVRMAQLIVGLELQDTFQLLVATNRHSGMPDTVIENIDRVYESLGMKDDPNVEMIVIDGDRVTNFSPDLAMPLEIAAKNKRDILMSGHRCHGEGRPTFCNACNLSLANSLGVAMSYKDGADIVITGDSPKEQLAYVKWIARLARKLGVETAKIQSFSDFLRELDTIAQAYFDNVYGSERDAQDPHYRVMFNKLKKGAQFISMYEVTRYELEDHWDFLTEFLGYQFDDLSFNFTESDCFNPALMAHIRGLRSQHVDEYTYQDGVAQYVDFALRLMASKDIPEELIESMQVRYANPELIRDKVAKYADETMGLSEENLICMVYSPFASYGKYLSRFIGEQHPSLKLHLPLIHRLLEKRERPIHGDTSDVFQRLEIISGLEFEDLAHLYHSSLIDLNNLFTSTLSTDPIAAVLEDDPHKTTIETPNGQRIISGR